MRVRPQDGHLHALSPEWPRYPFLSIPPAVRRRRLALLFPSEPESLADTLAPQPEIRQTSFIDAIRGERHIAENVRLHIDWQKPDCELQRCFKALLKRDRKHRPVQNLSARVLRADLKALGGLRLMREDKHKDSTLFGVQSEWIRARNRVQRILAKL